ncbi:MAG: ABC transporter permease [Cyanobacteria bacterium]|nr:ABC transporter permease [Cyanobacteriota bacterium]
MGLALSVFLLVFPSLLRPLPYPEAERIGTFILKSGSASGPQASEAHFNFWRSHSELFDHVAAFRRVVWKLEHADEKRDITVGRVSASFFTVFGAPPRLGRTFVAEDEAAAAQPTVVLGHTFWVRAFQSDPNVIGTTVRLDGKACTVIGVLASEFDREEFNPTAAAFSGGQPDAWVPFTINPASRALAGYFVTFAKLKPSMSFSGARNALDVLAAQFRADHKELGPTDGFTIDSYLDVALGAARLRLYILSATALFVLLIAVINVTNLAVVRTIVVERDLRLRAALGANGTQLMARMTRDHFVIASLGVSLGATVGLLIGRFITIVDRGSIPRIASAPATWTDVLVFAVLLWGIAVVVPATTTFITISRRGFSRTSPMVRGAGGSPRVGYVRALSVVFQTAACVLLLYGTTVLIGTFIALRSVDEGFDASNVTAMRMSFSGPRFAASRDMAAAIQKGISAANSVAGVEATAITCCLPLDRFLNLPFVIVDRPLTAEAHGVAGWVTVSDAFFATLRIPLLRGRVFSQSDSAGAAATVIVNKTLADTFWPDGSAVGQRVIIGGAAGPEFKDVPREIVGVVGDVRDVNLEQAPRAILYVPSAQLPDALNASNNRVMTQQWLIRTREGVAIRDLESRLRAATGQDVSRIRSMRDVLAQSTAARDGNALVMTLFGVTALVLAFVGVYGIVAYSVEQRQQETAIRMALGEAASHVRTRILREALVLWSAGLVLGLGASLALEKTFQQLVFGVPTFSTLILVSLAAVIGVVGLASAWEPARRASQSDVASALRSL